VTRCVGGLDGGLAATTTKTGGTILQLANLHGDISLRLPADTAVAPTVLDADEYGNRRPAQFATRYGWLGSKQRSTETPTGLTLMGVPVYNPDSGRFLSVDPVYRGGANAYEYCGANPVGCTDLSGAMYVRWWKPWWSPMYFIRMDLNKSETRWVAFGTGAAASFIGWAKDIKWIPGGWKYAITAIRGYLWYFTTVAAYAVARGKCTSIISGVTHFGSSYIPIPPTIWTRRVETN
jgi:RHS repeat-associated protein